MNEQERMAYLEADTSARYMGPCRRDEYTPHPPQFTLGSPYMILAQSSPLVLPPKDSFYSMEAYLYEIEINCTEPQFIEDYGSDSWTYSQDEMRGTFPNSPFVIRDICPVDPANDTFSVRGRTCWRIVDSHPENRGFLVGSGQGYNGIWSEWSEWQTFEEGVAVGQEPYNGPVFYWSVRMLTELIAIDGESLQDIFHRISGEWREVMELEEKIRKSFLSSAGMPIEHIAFTTKRDRQEYVEFAVPCSPGQAVTVHCLAELYDPEYRAVFDMVADPRFPNILSPAYDEQGNDLQNGATIRFSQGEPEGLPEPAPQEEEPQPEEPQQEETQMADQIYGEDTEAQISELVATIEEHRAEREAAKTEVASAVNQRIQDDMPNILAEVESELDTEDAEAAAGLDAEAEFQQRRDTIKKEVKARLSRAGQEEVESAE